MGIFSGLNVQTAGFRFGCGGVAGRMCAVVVSMTALGIFGCAAKQGTQRSQTDSAVTARASSNDDLVDLDYLEQLSSTRNLSHGRPKAVTPLPDGSGVLFLRSGPRSVVQDLYVFDCATATERVLLTAAQILGGGIENLTAEELARRERMRMTSRGIASFQLSKDGRKILVPLSGRLFVIDRLAASTHEIVSQGGFPIDPVFSPDGSLVGCVRDGEVFVAQASPGGREWALRFLDPASTLAAMEAVYGKYGGGVEAKSG